MSERWASLGDLLAEIERQAERVLRGLYILDGAGAAVPAPSWEAWHEFFERPDARRVAVTTLPAGVRVSTVFLALDHNGTLGGPPVLWETMIFGGRLDQQTWRYTSRAAAEAGHRRAVRLARRAMPPGRQRRRRHSDDVPFDGQAEL